MCNALAERLRDDSLHEGFCFCVETETNGIIPEAVGALSMRAVAQEEDLLLANLWAARFGENYNKQYSSNH